MEIFYCYILLLSKKIESKIFKLKNNNLNIILSHHNNLGKREGVIKKQDLNLTIKFILKAINFHIYGI